MGNKLSLSRMPRRHCEPSICAIERRWRRSGARSIAKCILIDKVIGALVMALAKCTIKYSDAHCGQLDRWFTTDDLGPTLSTVFISVVGFYFGQAAVKEIANMIRARK